jgi:SAM-dependent methyltransferase
MAGPWNANIHYDGRLDACVPASATSVLDVGCGDGFLAARLARRVPLVVAIDADAPVLDARGEHPHMPQTGRGCRGTSSFTVTGVFAKWVPPARRPYRAQS